MSVEEHIASPWLCPMTKCVSRAGNREQLRWDFRGVINDIAVSWSRERVVILSLNFIEVWQPWCHKELFRVPIEADGRASFVTILEDAKLIVSGYEYGSVRSWDGYTGEPVGEPMYNHTKYVNSEAIRGNLIVPCSSDGLLHRYNVTTGEVISNALQGHEDTVSRVVISGDGKMILSCSREKTIRRWGGDTGMAVDSPLREHSYWVTSLAISSDGKFIVSGDFDNIL